MDKKEIIRLLKKYEESKQRINVMLNDGETCNGVIHWLKILDFPSAHIGYLYIGEPIPKKCKRMLEIRIRIDSIVDIKEDVKKGKKK